MSLGRLLICGTLVLPAALSSACDAVVQPLQRVPWVADAPKAQEGGGEGDERVTLAVSAIVKQRCTPCHSATPSLAPEMKSVPFDTADQILAKKDRIGERAVKVKTMPFLNKTTMTDEERAVLGRWLEALPKS